MRNSRKNLKIIKLRSFKKKKVTSKNNGTLMKILNWWQRGNIKERYLKQKVAKILPGKYQKLRKTDSL